jgi:hypothetical protein
MMMKKGGGETWNRHVAYSCRKGPRVSSPLRPIRQDCVTLKIIGSSTNLELTRRTKLLHKHSNLPPICSNQRKHVFRRRVVTHPIPDHARCCLTSVFIWEPANQPRLNRWLNLSPNKVVRRGDLGVSPPPPTKYQGLLKTI